MKDLNLEVFASGLRIYIPDWLITRQKARARDNRLLLLIGFYCSANGSKSLEANIKHFIWIALPPVMRREYLNLAKAFVPG